MSKNNFFQSAESTNRRPSLGTHKDSMFWDQVADGAHAAKVDKT